MKLTTDSLALFVVLLPGFVSSVVLNNIVARKTQEALPRIVEALVFSFLIYSISLGVFQIDPMVKTNEQVTINRIFVLVALTLSVSLPLLLGFLYTTNLHMKILNRIRVTKRTSRENAWLDVFTEQDRHVICNLSNGRRVYGWPMYYSEDMEYPALYLFDPAWINDDGTYTEIGAHGIFLLEKDSIESIEFMFTEDELTLVNERRSNVEER